jgi:RHS repeat-associated protein
MRKKLMKGNLMLRTKFLGLLGFLVFFANGQVAHAISGSGEVLEATGGWKYSVPIEVPAFRGLEPKIDLRYNSSAPNGIAGVGWSVGGFSEITRSPVDWNLGLPVFFLDGQKLVACVSGMQSASCQTNGTHATEIETYLRVQYVASEDAWNVWQPDGKKFSYAARQKNNAGLTVRWGLSQIADTSGNKVDYNWACYSGDGVGRCYPASITYNTPVPTRVTFSYEQRSDLVSYQACGEIGVLRRRLYIINVLRGDRTLRAYVLGYLPSVSTTRSLLTEVTEFGAGSTINEAARVVIGSSLPPLKFEYRGQYPIKEWRENTAFAPPGNFEDKYLDDKLMGLRGFNFRGAGSTDLLLADGKSEAKLWSSSKAGWEPYSLAPFVLPRFMSQPGANDSELITYADLNGDGRTDIIHANEGPRLSALQNGILIYKWEETFVPPPLVGKTKLDPKCRFVDLTGDQRADYVCNSSNVWLNTPQGSKAAWVQVRWPGLPKALQAGMCEFADLNGDGLLDVLSRADSETFGSADAWLNTGDGFSKIPHVPFFSSWPSYVPDTGVRTVELNGDGMMDLIQTYYGKDLQDLNFGDSRYTERHAWINTGSNWLQDDSWIEGLPLIVYQGRNVSQGFAVMDVNGDGLSDLLLGYKGKIGGKPYEAHATWLNPNGFSDVMIVARNGVGGNTRIGYASSASWDASQMPRAMPTVSFVGLHDGGSASDTYYSYSGGLYDGISRRFLGFAYAKKILPCVSAPCPYVETWFHQDYGSATKPKTIITTDGSGHRLQRQTFSYTTNGVQVPYQSTPSVETTYQYNGNASVTARVRRAFDSYGNIAVEINDGDTSVVGDEVTAQISYAYNPNLYIVNKPAVVTQFAGAGVSGIQVAKTISYYDGSERYQSIPSRGLRTKTLRWLDVHNTYVESRTEYDSYGQIQRVRDENGGVTETLRSDGLHVSEIRDPLFASDPSHRKLITWHPNCEAPSSIVDENGGTTRLAYDVFCREISKELPSGDFVRTTYTFSPTGLLSVRTETRAADSASNVQWKIEYYDGLSRSIGNLSRGANGSTIVQTRDYDPTGQLSEECLPYYIGEFPRWTTHTYDALGRPLVVTHPDGSSIRWQYGLLSKVIQDERGNLRQQQKDALGRVTDVLDFIGGAWHGLAHEYDALGRVVKTTDDDGNQWLHQYDSLGRRIRSDDPDLGVWDFAFDASGNMTSQLDAKGIATCFVYDALNRTRSKTTACGTSQAASVYWGFDEPQSGFFNKNHPTSSTYAQGTGSTNFSYDIAGNLVDATYRIDGRSFNLKYSYDATGRVKFITYPDGDKLGTSSNPFTYDGAGDLFAIPNVVSNLIYSAKGQVLGQTNANGTTVNYTYSPLRSWMTGIRAQNASGIPILDLNYSYLPNGLPQSISSSVIETRNYTYDEIGQLTRATSPSSQQSWSYSPNGNLTWMDATAFNYGPAGKPAPHAVQSIANVSYTYDPNGNMLSSGTQTIDWDVDNRPVRIGASTFVYDADGNRIKKTEDGKTTYYLGSAVEVTDDVFTKYISVKNNVVAKRVGTATSWFYTDHQGTVLAIEDVKGVVQRQAFTAYGAPIGRMTEDLGYSGQRHDKTGLIYLHARYYDPTIGRFISPDTVVPSEAPIGLNRYAYANNSPTLFVDPSGHEPQIANSMAGFFLAAPSPNVVNDVFVKYFREGSKFFHLPPAVQAPTSNPFIDGGSGGSSNSEWNPENLFNPESMMQLTITPPNPVVVTVELVATGIRLLEGGLANAEAGAVKAAEAGAVKAAEAGAAKIPGRLARVIPDDPLIKNLKTLGPPGNADVFVTRASDLQHMNAKEIAEFLTIKPSPTGFRVIEFSTPSEGLATPINRCDPGFVGGGKTVGGALEFVIPNGSIPSDAITRFVR